MEKIKVYYPVEAFALMMVLFSEGMKPAMIVGIGLIFGDVLLHVLHENFANKYRYVVNAAGIIIFTLVTGYAMVYSGIASADIRSAVILGAGGILLAKHHEDIKEESHDYNRVLLEDSIAYLFYVLVAVLREFLAAGTVYGVKLTRLAFVSHSFGKTMFALVFAGIAIAVVNQIFNEECKKNAALWVCIPIICLETAFVLGNVPEGLGMIVTVLFMLVVYLYLRKLLNGSKAKTYFRGVPLEMITLGMMYMIFSVFA